MTPLAPGSALARALDRERGRYNARVALARRRGPLDLSRLSRALAELVAPAVEAVAAVAPERADAACEALFDLAVDLVGLEVLGAEARHPVVRAAWQALPALGHHVAAAPRRLAAALTNAAVHLESMALHGAVRPAAWIAGLVALAPSCPDAASLLACGQVLAWRAGAAHWRASAMAVWAALPPTLARAALGLAASQGQGDASLQPLRRAMEQDPFRPPADPEGQPALRRVGRVGGFRGFGGPFLAPPRLVSDGERIWALDGEDAYTLHADCFGRIVVRTPGGPAGAPGPEIRVDGDGTLRACGLRARFPELAGARAAAGAGTLVAVLPPHTHEIVLVARTAAVLEGA